MSDNQAELQIMNSLNVDLDTVPDLPEYCNPPTGMYNVTLTDIEVGTVGEGDKKRNQLKMVFTVGGLIELANAADESRVPEAGSLFTTTFNLTGEEGIKYLKKTVKEMSEALQEGNMLALLEKLKGLEMKAKVKSRGVRREDSSMVYYSSVESLYPAD